MNRLFARMLAIVATCWSSAAAGWQVTEVATPGPVAEIARTGDAAAVRIGSVWHGAGTCSGGICLAATLAPQRRRPPKGGLPDGWLARAPGAGIAEAWYGEPTGRYDHGILGDTVEAGALLARDAGGRRYRAVLPPDQVFEDLVPRIVDIDGDGRNDVVTIRSFLDRGASIAVFSPDGPRLRLRTATSPIGHAHRWLNIAAIADFDGDGALDIAVVTTPHIGGTLEFWTWSHGGLRRLAAAPGFSNHRIGSRALGLAAVADADGDGRVDLALPDAGRRVLMIVSLRAGRIETLARLPLPEAIGHDIAAIRTPAGPTYLIGTESGRLVSVSR